MNAERLDSKRNKKKSRKKTTLNTDCINERLTQHTQSKECKKTKKII